MSKVPRSSEGTSAAPVVLDELRAHAELGGEGVGEVDLEALEARRRSGSS
jgi:hypothetical protein